MAITPPRDQARASVLGRGVLMPLYLAAFCSGSAALIYEVTWSRMLGLTFGSTTLAAAAVIAGFMGGMGLGAWQYHRISDRTARPLVIYGILEIAIAITTALLTRTFYALPDIFASASEGIPPGIWLNLLRFLWVFVLLVIPAALMGATFPALCTVIIRNARGVDRHMGMIYGINTIGAAAGAFFAGLFLIEKLGLTYTVTVANGINLAVGLGALALAGSSRWAGSLPYEAGKSETAIPTDLPRRLTGLVLFASGLATLSYEVLWFRALRFLVGNSTYAFTIVLVIFLTGLGLGSLLLERATRRRFPERDLALCQCAIAVLALAAMGGVFLVATQPGLHEYVSIFSDSVRHRAWWSRLLIDGGLAALIMLPATLLMGLSFPLAGRLFLGDVRKLSARVGGAYLLANMGSIIGSLLAAMVLLPLFGTIGGTKVIACVNSALGILLLVWIRRQTPRWSLPAGVTLALVAVMAIALPRSPSRLGQESLCEAGSTVVYSEDGDLATVEVHENAHDSMKKIMTIDGTPIGWSLGYRTERPYRKQVILAHLPMLLDSRIRDTLNVGLGSGGTLYSLARYTELRTLDCVEISRAVVHAAELFPESVVFADPRVDVIVDDVVHFLLRAGRDYDLIISDGKQDAFFSGNAPLLCREFYRHALDRLTEEGIFIQWFQMGMLSSEFRINLRTVCEVFPHVEVFCYSADAYLVGAKQPVFGRPQMSSDRFAAVAAEPDLAPHFLDSPSALLAGWCSGKPQLIKAVGEGPISTWDHLLTDFSSFKATPEEWAVVWGENTALLLKAENIPRVGADIFELPEPIFRESRALLRRAFAEAMAGNAAATRELSRQAVRINPRDKAFADAQLVGMRDLAEAERLFKLGTDLGRQGKLEEAAEHLAKVLELEPNNVSALNNLGIVRGQQGKLAEAIEHFSRALKLQADDVLAHRNLGDVYQRQGKLMDAVEHYSEVIRIEPDNALAHRALGDTYMRQGKPSEAGRHYSEALRIEPEDVAAHMGLGIALGMQKRFEEAIERFCEVSRIDPRDGRAHFLRGGMLQAQGKIKEAVAAYRESSRLAPEQVHAANALAWVLATHHASEVRDGAEAVKLAESTCEATGRKDPMLLDTLAAAYAEAGRYEEALATTRKAVELAGNAGKEELAKEIAERLKLYKAGRPYHQAAP